eukprot:TRINITY_DN54811_c0_g1_i1.p1 TRINITY_DN54811_c0_g1~~TRINITY_DN54811_c0_g1_i1.p1  ORF type:complete len:333 (+),score=22.06 TRINITY_DN54811_c0_g1_i1:20-1018(+)
MFGWLMQQEDAKQEALPSLDLDGIASFIQSSKCKKIGFLTGAGMSVAAGIPDFRSPGGMYDTLRPELLTASEPERKRMASDPTTVVCWDLFRVNQLPYLELRRPFILGIAEQKWKATLAHYFVQVCHDKGLLDTLFTQNIDGLDFQTDVPKDKIVSVHGTLGAIECEFCKKSMDNEEFRKNLRENVRDIYNPSEGPSESSPIYCPSCSKAGVKPATVLYGRSLPAAFHDAMDNTSKFDLLIIIGTSLTVSPANSVPTHVRSNCVRLVVNDTTVGQGVGIKYGDSSVRDVFAQGTADEVLWQLAQKLGWQEDVYKYHDRMSEASQKVLKPDDA